MKKYANYMLQNDEFRKVFLLQIFYCFMCNFFNPLNDNAIFISQLILISKFHNGTRILK